MEFAASAYIEHEHMRYHLPTLPLPLLKHQVNLQKKKLQPNLKFDADGNAFVNRILQEVIDSFVTN